MTAPVPIVHHPLDHRKVIFDAVRAGARPGLFDDPSHVLALDNLLDAFGVDRALALDSTAVTEAMVLEILEHEAIVCEAYKDSEGVWTWGVGVTDTSGHLVQRYKDNPQTIEHCLAVYVWLLRSRYLPEVLRAFSGYRLKEHELAAALSFHWNTGAIGKASWVGLVKAGKRDAARKAFMDYRRPASIVPRREAERDLFFDGRWTQDGKVIVWPVKKPGYTPNWARPEQVDVRDAVREALQEGA